MSLVWVLGADDPGRLAAFWSALLDRTVVASEHGLLLPGPVPLLVEPTTLPRTKPARMHVHLTSDEVAQDATVARVLELGGRHLDVGQLPEEGHVVMADPEGNALCVIEAGNRFLAGTGFLGELACDGSRAVGVFWSAALGWPLVWDSGDETAVQAPSGGTKVAWGGAAETAPAPDLRHRLALIADDLDATVAKLVGLGATVVAQSASRATLRDPDGQELDVLLVDAG